MTNNIEKMYELAKVKKEYYSFKTEKEEFTWELDENGNDKHNCIFCGEPEIKTRHFTPAKQLKLIKWLAFEKRVSIKFTNGKWHLNTAEMGISVSEKYEPFEQLLADFICNLWEDLTDEQREEIKRILE